MRRTTLPDGRQVWLVTGYAAVRRVLLDPRLSKDSSRMGAKAPLAALPAEVRNAIATDMLNADPPEHTRLRTMVAGPFGRRQVAGHRPLVERIAGELLDALPPAGVADLLDAYAGPLATRVLAALLGIPAADCDQIRHWSDEFVGELLSVSDRLLRVTGQLSGYVENLVERRRADPGDDLVSALIAPTGGGTPQRVDELSSAVFVLLIAGQTAMAQLIVKGLHLLLTNPGERARVEADPALLATAVEEFLRHDPPLRITAFRITTAPVEIDGTVVPADEIVLCSLLDANHDPARFADPDRLDVGRRDNHHLAFGHGLHHCLGAGLARLQAEVAIGAFLRRYPGAQLAVPPTGVPVAEQAIMSRITALPVRLYRETARAGGGSARPG